MGRKSETSTSTPMTMTSAPIDYYYVVYLILFWEGVGNLFPWNAFITASSYFSERFCGTYFEGEFENYFSITFTVSQTIGLALSIMYQDRITLRNKIIWPLLFYAIIFGITTVLVTIENIDATVLFYLTLLSAFLCGLCGAILSAGLFGLGAMFPPAYTAALMNGQGLAGLVVSVSAIVTIVSAPAPDDQCSTDDGNVDDDCSEHISYSALAYFIIATLVLLSCIVTFLSLDGLPFATYFVQLATQKEIHEDNITNPLIPAEKASDKRNNSHDLSAQSVKSISSPPEGNNGPSPDRIDSSYQGGESTYYENENVKVGANSGVSLDVIFAVFKKLRVPSFSVLFCFTVTISLFPSLIVLIESANQCNNSPNQDRFSNDLFVPFLFLMFNLCDFIGRCTAGLGASTALFTAKTIWIPSVCRLVFIPLFLLCKISDSQFPTVFTNDAWPIIIMVFFAFTNGYVATSSMMLGSMVAESHEAALAGTIMVFSLTAGLMFGASFSFLLVYISKGSA
jgi:equilibrative nucleoside transporter 1/2/3